MSARPRLGGRCSSRPGSRVDLAFTAVAPPGRNDAPRAVAVGVDHDAGRCSQCAPPRASCHSRRRLRDLPPGSRPARSGWARASVQQLPRMQRSNAKLTAAVETYLTELRRVWASGGATGERSSYGPLANLLNAVGATLRPKVFCVAELADQGAGHPDRGGARSRRWVRVLRPLPRGRSDALLLRPVPPCVRSGALRHPYVCLDPCEVGPWPSSSCIRHSRYLRSRARRGLLRRSACRSALMLRLSGPAIRLDWSSIVLLMSRTPRLVNLVRRISSRRSGSPGCQRMKVLLSNGIPTTP